MPVIYTFPTKVTPLGSDLVLISDSAESLATKNATISSLVTSNAIDVVDTVTASGSGITASPNKGNVVISNTGVTSLVAGNNITISGSTGTVTISAAANGNIGGSGTANSVALFSNTDNIGDSIMKQFSGNDGSGFNDTYFQLAGTGGAWMGNIRLGSVGGVAGGDGYLLDSTGVRGSDGQVLTSTGFQSKWEDIPNTGLQIGTFANKTTTLSAQNSSISFTSADNGTSVSVASTLSVGSITAKTVPYVNGGEFFNSNLEFTDSTNMTFGGNVGISNGKLSIATGNDKLTLKGPSGGSDYELQLPSEPTTENLVLTVTGGASPYVSSWAQPTTGTVSGSGTADTLPIWKTGTELTNSSISQNANDDITIGGAILYITPYVSGGLKIKDDGSQVKLSGPGASVSDYELKLPSKPNAGGQVLTAPATLGSSPYQLEWTDPSSVTSTNNVTASANSLNLQGSSSTAPTFGAPLNINYAGRSASGVQGTATAIHIDLTPWDGTGDDFPARGITCDLKRSTTALHVNNADQPSALVAEFINNNGQTVGSISCTSSATAYNASSDYRIKENVVDMTGAVDRVKQLKPSRFNFTADPSKIVDGFLAHEAQEVVPESVTGVKDALYPNGDPLLQGIDQSKIVPLLTGAIKELIARIEELEAK